MPLSMDDSMEVAALIAKTLAAPLSHTKMGVAHEIIADLEEAGWEIAWYDHGPPADPGAELGQPLTALEQHILASLEQLGGAKVVPFPQRWN